MEDVLSVTNILSLLLQLDKKDFSTIAQPVTEILKNFGENIDTNYLKNFNNANEIIEKIKVYERQNIVSFGLRKCQQQNHNLIKDILDKKVIKPFIDESIKEMKNAFNISNLPVLNAFLKLDPQKIPDKDSLLFENYGVEVTLCITFMEKVKKTAFKGGQLKWMPYMIPNFHAFYWSLAILKVMFVNKKQHSHKNIWGRKNLYSPNLTYLMHKNTK